MKVQLGDLIINQEEVVTRHHGPFSIEPIENTNASYTMREGVRLLKFLRVKHWLSSGNLLGLYRDGTLIPHDTDIDVNVMMTWDTDEANRQSRRIIETFTKTGFQLIRSTIYRNHFMQTAFIHQETDVIFDIYYFYRGLKPKIAFNVSAEGLIQKPLRYISKLDVLRFENENYPIPNHIEEFLEWRFGADWKIPKKKKVAWQDEATHLEVWHD